MIVIRGHGRSGTSLLACPYQEPGFDPGGSWQPDVNAGLESLDIVGLNDEILERLGFHPLGARAELPSSMRSLLKPLLPGASRRKVHATARQRMSRQAHADHVRWSSVPTVAAELAPRLVHAASARQVVKDPRFCITLPVWLEAGADISFVVATVRHAAASAASRTAAGMSDYESEDLLRSDVVFQLGCLHDALGSYDVPSSVIRFPDWTEDPDGLAKTLPWPSPVPDGGVAHALSRIVEPDLVHQP